MPAFGEDSGVSMALIKEVIDASTGSYAIQLSGRVLPAKSLPPTITYSVNDVIGVVSIGTSGEFAILGLIQAAT